MGHQYFNTEKLGEWLDLHLEGGGGIRVQNVRRVTGGKSAETYIFDIVQNVKGRETTRPLVMRRDPVGGPVERDIKLEFDVMKALGDTPVPVPQVYGLELDPSWLERPFFVEEFITGTADLVHFSSPEYTDKRESINEQFFDIMARIHTLDIKQSRLDFLENPGEGTAPAAREVALWEDLYQRNKVEPYPIIHEAFIWMKQNLPKAPRISLVHGEYRHGNFLFDSDKITAIVDWEYTHLGDPVEDIGWAFAMQNYYATLGLKGFSLQEGRKEAIERYQKITGFAVDWQAIRFWEVFTHMKTSVIRATMQNAFREGRLDLGTAVALGGLNNNTFDKLAALIEI